GRGTSRVARRRPGVPREPGSFPARRSSDLRGLRSARACTKSRRGRWAGRGTSRTAELAGEVGLSRAVRRAQVSGVRGPIFGRSLDRKNTRLNSSHVKISYAVVCLEKRITGH